MDKQVAYWLTESLESLDTAKVLYDNRKYLEAAFFCHLSVEKMLIAFYTKRNDKVPPKTHNLFWLVKQSRLTTELNEFQLNFLADLSPFQLEGRYPDDRRQLYKRTPAKVFKELVENTEEQIKWFEHKLKYEN